MKKIIGTSAMAIILLAMCATTMTAFADEAKWEAPVDDISAWVGSTGDVILGSDGCWLDADVVDGALVVHQNENCKVFYPYFRVKDGVNGLFEAEEGDILNIDVTLEADKSVDNAANHNIAVSLTFAAIDEETGSNITVNIDKAIAEANPSINVAETGSLLAGDIKASVNLSEAVKQCTSKANWEAIFGDNGDPTCIAAAITITTGKYAPKTIVTLRELSITSDRGDITSDTDASNSSSNTSAASSANSEAVSSKSSTLASSSKNQVSTGESILPIVGTSALATISVFVIVALRKKSK